MTSGIVVTRRKKLLPSAANSRATLPSLTSMMALVGLVLLLAVPATFVAPPSARTISWTNHDFAYDGGDRLSPSFPASQGDVLTADLTVYYVKNGTVTERHPGFWASQLEDGQFVPIPYHCCSWVDVPEDGLYRIIFEPTSDPVAYGATTVVLCTLTISHQDPYASARLPLAIGAIVVLAVATGRHLREPVRSASSPRRYS